MIYIMYIVTSQHFFINVCLNNLMLLKLLNIPLLLSATYVYVCYKSDLVNVIFSHSQVLFCVMQVVMTIIVAFILDAFVFRMNYSRKNREPLDDPEGSKCLESRSFDDMFNKMGMTEISNTKMCVF